MPQFMTDMISIQAEIKVISCKGAPAGDITDEISPYFSVTKLTLKPVHLDIILLTSNRWQTVIQINDYIAVLVINYGISNTIVLEIP